MSAETRVGLLGGTLDPIHLGHVETACAAWRALQLDRVYVIPSNVPPHRAEQPVASPYHRFAMTALAVNGLEHLEASDLELSTPGPSYTTDTLTRFSRATGLDASQIFFITGADAFAEIETWHRYPDVLDLANFVIVSRPRFPAEDLRHQLPALSERMTSLLVRPPAAGREQPAPGSQQPAFNRSSIFLLDARTPDVSSTEIRQRLSARRSISGLVPGPVERHIAKHGLYVGNHSLAGRPLA
jgi:nicotinate-nucleotide adenylyltransferase